MTSFEKPFRGLPAEIRLMIWECVALPVIELTPDNSKSAFEFLIKLAQSNSTVYQELKAVIDRHGLSFNAKSLTKTSIKPFWRSTTFRRPLVSKIKLFRVQASPPEEYSSQGILLHEIWAQFSWAQCSWAQCSWARFTANRVDQLQTVGSVAPIQRLEVVITGETWESTANFMAETELDDSIEHLRTCDPDKSDTCYGNAAYTLDIDSYLQRNLVEGRVADHVVLNLVRLNQWQRDWLVKCVYDMQIEMALSPEDESGCRMTFGRVHTRSTIDPPVNAPTYCYQIHFDKV